MIDDNELLLVWTGSPNRTRKSQANVIGVYMPPPPEEFTRPNEYCKEKEKQSHHKKKMRKVAFIAARNIYVIETASTVFGSALENKRSRHNSLSVTISTANAEFYSKLLKKV